MEEELIIVNEKDEVVGSKPRSEVNKKRLLHRGTAILVFNSKGKLFIHKRAMTKTINPGLWDMFAGGGVAKGETYESNAEKELEEELGIELKPEFLFKTRYTDQQNDFFVSVFKCLWDGKINIQKEEIMEGKFVTLKQLNELIRKEKFCSDSIMLFNEYLNSYHEQLVTVNEDDRIIGKGHKAIVKKENMLRRGTACLVFNSKWELFVHQRTFDKLIFPGMYDMFAGGGVAVGETYDSNIKKELEEELGIKDAKPVFLFNELTEFNVFVSVYKYKYDGQIKIQKEEIINGKFMSIKELKELMKKEKFCPDSIIFFNKYMEEFHERKQDI